MLGVLLSATGPSGEAPGRTATLQEAWLLLGTLALLLALFVAGLVGILLVRRRRRASRRPAPLKDALQDPWAESARRMRS